MKASTRVKNLLADMGDEELMRLYEERQKQKNPTATPVGERHREEVIRRQKESVLAYVQNSKAFDRVICEFCKRPFATTYARVAHCSDFCVDKHLEKLGIKFNWDKSPTERWIPKWADPEEAEDLYPVPLRVPPDVLEYLDASLDSLDSQDMADTLRDELLG